MIDWVCAWSSTRKSVIIYCEVCHWNGREERRHDYLPWWNSQIRSCISDKMSSDNGRMTWISENGNLLSRNPVDSGQPRNNMKGVCVCVCVCACMYNREREIELCLQENYIFPTFVWGYISFNLCLLFVLHHTSNTISTGMSPIVVLWFTKFSIWDCRKSLSFPFPILEHHLVFSLLPSQTSYIYSYMWMKLVITSALWTYNLAEMWQKCK